MRSPPLPTLNPKLLNSKKKAVFIMPKRNLTPLDEVNIQLSNIMFARAMANTHIPADDRAEFNQLNRDKQLKFVDDYHKILNRNIDKITVDFIRDKFTDTDYALDDNLRRNCINYWIYMSWNVFNRKLITNDDVSHACSQFGVSKSALKKHYERVERYRNYDDDYTYYQLSRKNSKPMFGWFKNKRP